MTDAEHEKVFVMSYGIIGAFFLGKNTIKKPVFLKMLTLVDKVQTNFVFYVAYN